MRPTRLRAPPPPPCVANRAAWRARRFRCPRGAPLTPRIPPALAQPAAPSFPAASSTAPAAAVDTSALIDFNKRFRELVDAKDAKEREGKAARKAAGKAALKKMLSERSEVIASRKGSNRAAEAAAEKEMLNALEGESWGRVVSLVDIHGHVAAPAAGAAADKKVHAKAADKGEVGDTTRMKDILLTLKAKPLPTPV